MSLTHTDLVYLMAYVDGQVDDDELPEVEALLARSAEARSLVAQHAAMGDWVREAADARSFEAGADKIADVVLHEIDKLGGGKVVSLERERARLALNRQRTKEFGALAAVAAIAAAIWLIPARTAPVASNAPAKSAATSSPHSPQAPQAGAPGVAAPSSAPQVAVAATEPEPGQAGQAGVDGQGVDVQTVESPSHPFSIFYVPAAAGVNAQASSVVVWIAE